MEKINMWLLLLLSFSCLKSQGLDKELAKNMLGNSMFINGINSMKQGDYSKARYWFRSSRNMVGSMNQKYCWLFIEGCNRKIGKNLFLRGVNNLKERNFDKALGAFTRSFFLLQGDEKIKKYIIISNYLKKKSQGEGLQEVDQMVRSQKQFQAKFMEAKQAYLAMNFKKACILFARLKAAYPSEKVVNRYYEAAKEGMTIKEDRERGSRAIHQKALDNLKAFYQDVAEQEEKMLNEQRKRQNLALEKFSQAKEKYQNKRYYEAAELMQQAMLLQPEEQVFQNHYEFYQGLAQLESERVVNLKEVQNIQQRISFYKQRSAYLDKARLAVLEGQFDVAKELLTSLLKKDSTDVNVQFYLNLIKEVELKKEVLDKNIREKIGDWVETQEDEREEELQERALSLLEQSLQTKNYDRAIDIFNHAMKSWDNKEVMKISLRDMFFQGAVQLLKDKKYQEAKLFFDVLIEKDKQEERNIYLRYKVLCEEAIAKSEEDKKVESLSMSVLQHQDQVRSSLEQAKEYHRMEEYLLANKLLEDLLSIDPTNIQVIGFKKMNDHALRKFEEQKVKKLRMEEETTLILSELKEKEMLRQKKDILMNKGIEYYKKEEYSMAHAVFEDMIKKGYDDDIVLDYKNSAYSFIKLKESRQRELLDGSKKTLQEESKKLFDEALSLYNQGYYYEAVNLFQKSWEVFPEDAEQFEQARHYVKLCSKNMNEESP